MSDKAALAESIFGPLWLDNPDRPTPRPALTGEVKVDLLIIGGGFTGLWTALRALERDPGCSTLLIEADRIAEHATGRNGGFCEASLTHGEENGMSRWPTEWRRCENWVARTWMTSRPQSPDTASTAASCVGECS